MAPMRASPIVVAPPENLPSRPVLALFAGLVGSRHALVGRPNPTNASSVLRITSVANLPPLTVTLLSSANRVYSLCGATSLEHAPWLVIPDQSNVVGPGAAAPPLLPIVVGLDAAATLPLPRVGKCCFAPGRPFLPIKC